MGTDCTWLIKAAATICSGGVSGGLAELPQFKDGHNLRASVNWVHIILCLIGSCSSWQPTLNWLGWHWKLHDLPSGTGFCHLKNGWCSQKCRNFFVLVILSLYYGLCWVQHLHVYDCYTELGAITVWGQHLIDKIRYALCCILSPPIFDNPVVLWSPLRPLCSVLMQFCFSTVVGRKTFTIVALCL